MSKIDETDTHISAKVPRELWQKIGVIAERRCLSRLAVMDKYLLPVVEKEYRRCVEEMNRELGKAGA